MALVHDVIPPFQLFQPATVDEALDLLDTRGAEAWVLAGGMDSMDWLKDRTKRTSAVVELGGLDPETIVTPGIFVHRVVIAGRAATP